MNDLDEFQTKCKFELNHKSNLYQIQAARNSIPVLNGITLTCTQMSKENTFKRSLFLIFTGLILNTRLSHAENLM